MDSRRFIDWLEMGDDPAESWARAIHHPKELTDKDVVVVDALLTKEWLNLSRLELLVDFGYAGGVDGPATFVARQYLNHPFGKRWWETGGAWTEAPAPHARDVVENVLKDDKGASPSLRERYDRLRATSVSATAR
jgi:hypothetical protein